MLKLFYGRFESVEGGMVCQDGPAILNTNRDEVDHRLFLIAKPV